MSDIIVVSPGEASGGIVLNEDDAVWVWGGAAYEITVNDGGELWVAEGVANNTVVNSGGFMDVDAVADATVVNSYGRLYIESAAVCMAIVESGGYVYVDENAARTTFVANSFSGLVLSEFSATLHSGTTANSTLVSGDSEWYHRADLEIYNGGVANDTTVSFFGNVLVSNGGVANNTTVDFGGDLIVLQGGVANATVVNDCGSLTVDEGGVANATVVNSGGMLYLDAGGAVSDTTVNDGGSMYVDTDALALAIRENGGFVEFDDGADVTFAANVMNGKSLAWMATLHSGTTANATALNDQGYLYVYSGGVANETTVNPSSDWRPHAALYVSNGGVANRTTMNSYGSMSVYAGGVANDTTISSGGKVFIVGGVANDTTISSGGSFFVSAGEANDTTVNNRGILYVEDSGTASDTIVNSGGSMYVSNGGMADATTLNSSSYLRVYKGGSASDTTVNPNGYLFIDNSVSVLATRENGGYVYVTPGANATFVSNSFSDLVLSRYQSATLHSGTTANAASVSGGKLYVYDGGVANDTVLKTFGYMYVSSGGAANSAVMYGGNLYVEESGAANDTIMYGGYMDVSAGGTATNTTVNDGGYMDIYSGSILRGRHVFGGTISAKGAADAAAEIVFAVEQRTPKDGYIIRNLDNLNGAVFSITVAADQESGEYKLADGVSDFDRTITIYIDSGKSASLTVGNAVVIDGIGYTLNFADSALSLTIGGMCQQKPVEVFKANTMVSSATTVWYKILSGDGEDLMHVHSSGSVVVTTINSGGTLEVYSGGLAYDNKVNSGTLRVFGGLASDNRVQAVGDMHVYAGGSAEQTVVNFAEFYVSGGSVTNNNLASRGYMDITDRGVALSTTLNSSSVLLVSEGTATSNVIRGSSLQYVYAGGTADVNRVEDGFMIVSGGTAVSNTVSWNGRIFVSEPKGLALSNVVSSGMLCVYAGGSAENTLLISSGSMHVSEGGSASDTAISGFGLLQVFSGGSVKGTGVYHSGTLDVCDDGRAVSTLVYSEGSLLLSSTGRVDSTVIYSGGVLHTSRGGTVDSIFVHSAGRMIVTDGMTLLNTQTYGGTVALYVSMGISTAEADVDFAVYERKKLPINFDIVSNLDWFDPRSYTITVADDQERGVYMLAGCAHGFDRTVTLRTLSGLSTSINLFETVFLGGEEYTLFMISGSLTLRVGPPWQPNPHDDVYGFWVDQEDDDEDEIGDDSAPCEGRAVEIFVGKKLVSAADKMEYKTLVGGGENLMHVHSGGVVFATEVKAGGYAVVFRDGIMEESFVASGGRLKLKAGAYLAGDNTFGGTVQLTTGNVDAADAVVIFAVDQRSTDDDVIVDRLDRLNAGAYCITISADQKRGTYKLAGRAAEFSQTITIHNTAGATGSLSLTQSAKLDNVNCSLKLDSDGVLSLVLREYFWPHPVPDRHRTRHDINGDGRADIVMTIAEAGHGDEGATGAWLVLEDQTKAWCSLSQRNPGWEIFGTGWTDPVKIPADVYVKSSDNVVLAWVTDDTGSVTGWVPVGEFDSDTQVLGLGDFNGDGQTDLLLRNLNGAVGCYFTSGDVTGWNRFQSLGDEWTVSAVGDFDGDGRDDVVLKHDAGFAGSWLTQSDYTMAWENLDTLPEGFAIVGAGDFDGDGTDDVLLQQGTYYGAWLVKNGNAMAWMGLDDLGDVTVEQIADFDGDGRDDLRIRTAAGDLGAMLVKGEDTLEWKYYGSVGPEWSTAFTAI